MANRLSLHLHSARRADRAQGLRLSLNLSLYRLGKSTMSHEGPGE
jgi:hypothetical protein